MPRKPPTYTCDSCGACCRLMVEIGATDLMREPRLRAVTRKITGDGDRFLLADGSVKPCPMLGDDCRCTIYNTRPNLCVEFEAGSYNCQEARRIAGLPDLLPDQGPAPAPDPGLSKYVRTKTPCPFCGNAVVCVNDDPESPDDDPKVRRHYVSCAGCGASGPSSLVRANALAHWAGRASVNGRGKGKGKARH